MIIQKNARVRISSQNLTHFAITCRREKNLSTSIKYRRFQKKSCKSLRLSIVLCHHVNMYCAGKAEKRRRLLRILKSKLVRACVRANLAFGILNLKFWLLDFWFFNFGFWYLYF